VDHVDRLIDEYHVRSAVDIEDGGKTELLIDLEDHAADPRVFDLYATIVADPAEYDLARIECLKILALYPPESPADRQRVGRVIAQTLWPDEDYLVRQYAAMSLGPYAGDDEVFEALRTVLIHDDDVDVRHNALSSVEEAGPDDRLRALLPKLVGDPELGSAVKRTLADWQAQ